MAIGALPISLSLSRFLVLSLPISLSLSTSLSLPPLSLITPGNLKLPPRHTSSPDYHAPGLPSRLSPANQPPALSPAAVEVLPLAPGVPLPAPHVQHPVRGTAAGLVVAHQRVAPGQVGAGVEGHGEVRWD